MNVHSNADTPLEDIDYFDGEFLQDPYPTYARLRAEAPVFRDPKNNIVYVSTFDLVSEVCRNTKTFSSKFAHLFTSSGRDEIDPEVIEIMSRWKRSSIIWKTRSCRSIIRLKRPLPRVLS